MSLFADTYCTVAGESTFELRERGSRFLSFVFPVLQEADVKEHLRKLRDLYPDASHHCYAFRMGTNGDQFRVNDDGEPSNSAGRPILRAIQSAGVTNVLVVVVRYFGGKLLGVPGLIAAYGDAATFALRAATIIEKEVCSFYRMEYPFELEHEAYRFLRQQNASIGATHYSPGQCSIEFSIRQSAVERLMVFAAGYHQFKMHYLYTT